LIEDKKNIFFVGIGGIGMSALARYFNQQGVAIAGYDKTPSPLTDKLQEEGIEILFEDDENRIPSAYKNKENTLVCITPAIPLNAKIYHFFKQQGFEIKKRAEILGIVTRSTINLSVAGTHGKTTTSCIVASILQHSSLQFSAFLGGISANLASNYYYQEAEGEHFSISEADEFDRSFLHLNPQYAVITSTDADHLDIYGKKETIEATYQQFAGLVKSNVFYALHKCKINAGVSYSATHKDAVFTADNVVVKPQGTEFDFVHNGKTIIEKLYLNIPGVYNLENAIGASAMCLAAGVDKDAIRQGLAQFKGIKRRFEFIVRNEEAVYIDDYAHHPSELEALIESVKALYPTKKITAVFQPHLFSRTQDFLDGFADVLSQIDNPILIPIYPARELPIEGVTSEAILQKMTNDKAIHLEKEEVVDHIKSTRPEVLLTLGAGDIDRLVQPLRNALLNES
jgi:UDP-N-acetylmuramate--alanine ligase